MSAHRATVTSKLAALHYYQLSIPTPEPPADSFDIPWGQVLAAAVVATAPAAALVLLFPRRIVQGLTAGALKG